MQIIWTKEELINKAVGALNGFQISHRMIEMLYEEPPASVSEFPIFVGKRQVAKMLQKEFDLMREKFILRDFHIRKNQNGLELHGFGNRNMQ